jgi:hypothetical protein
MTGDILSDLFHACAFHAFLEQAAIEQTMPPDCETTRRRAYQLYEEHLAEKNGRPRQPANRAA